VHEYPKRDTPYVEDMGRRARQWPVQGFIINPDYFPLRDALIAACETKGPGVLVHPYLGQLTVICDRYAMAEDRDEGGYCTFNFDFVEAGKAASVTVDDDTPGLVLARGVGFKAIALAALDAVLTARLVARIAIAPLADVVEAVGILNLSLKLLLGSVPGINTAGETGSAFYFACTDLMASGETEIRAGALADDFSACFAAATAAGATLAGMELVRAGLAALTPAGAPGIALMQAAIRFALMQQGAILSATMFTSSNDALAAIAQVNAGFEPAEEYAADNSDQANYQALLDLHAAVIRDLTLRGLALPSLVTYAVPRSLPSLVLAQRLYQDPRQADQLVAQNKVPHPAFMPAQGVCLSV
jgi:prophage DNA circulation protein